MRLPERKDRRRDGRVPEKLAEDAWVPGQREAQMRTCRKCLKPKPESEFGVNNFFSDKKARTCKRCNRDHTRELRARMIVLLRTTKVKVSHKLMGIR